MLNKPRRKTRACKVCGGPTISKYGICLKNARCARVQNRYRRTGRIDTKPVPQTQSCKVCGLPTTARLGICSRTSKCHNEAMCRRKGYTKRLFCAGCGGPMRSHCKWRFCMRNPQCRALHDAEMRRVDGERFREYGRRSLAKHGQKYRGHKLVLRRLRGVRPANVRGRNHSSWAGGRIVFCFVCGQCAGWRSPSQIKRRKRFLCREHGHGHDNWKWTLVKHRYESQQAVPRVPQASGDR